MIILFREKRARILCIDISQLSSNKQRSKCFAGLIIPGVRISRGRFFQHSLAPTKCVQRMEISTLCHIDCTLWQASRE